MTANEIISKLRQDYIPDEVMVKYVRNTDRNWLFECSPTISAFIPVGTVLMVQKVKFTVTNHEMVHKSTIYFKMEDEAMPFPGHVSDFLTKLIDDYHHTESITLNTVSGTTGIWAFDLAEEFLDSFDQQIAIGSFVMFRKCKLFRTAAQPSLPRSVSIHIPSSTTPVSSITPGVIPYEYMFLFHDIGNCPMPEKKVMRNGDKKIIMRDNNTPAFSNVYSNISGLDVFHDILRYGVRHLYSTQEEFEAMEHYSFPRCIYRKVEAHAVRPEQKSIWSSSSKTMEDYGRNVFVAPSGEKKNSDDIRLMGIITDQIEACVAQGITEKSVFVIVGGDKDFFDQVQRARMKKIDVVLIHSSDNRLNPIMKKIASHTWDVWNDIIDRASQSESLCASSGGGGGERGGERGGGKHSGGRGRGRGGGGGGRGRGRHEEDGKDYVVATWRDEIVISHTLSYYLQGGIGQSFITECLRENNINPKITVEVAKIRDSSHQRVVKVILHIKDESRDCTTRELNHAHTVVSQLVKNIREGDVFKVHSKTPNEIGRDPEIAAFAKLNHVSVFCPGVTKERHRRATPADEAQNIFLSIPSSWKMVDIVQFCTNVVRVSVNKKFVEIIEMENRAFNLCKFRIYIPYHDPHFDQLLQSARNKCLVFDDIHYMSRFKAKGSELLTNIQPKERQLLKKYEEDADSDEDDLEEGAEEGGALSGPPNVMDQLLMKSHKVTVQSEDLTLTSSVQNPLVSATVILVYANVHESGYERVKDFILQRSDVIFTIQLWNQASIMQMKARENAEDETRDGIFRSYDEKVIVTSKYGNEKAQISLQGPLIEDVSNSYDLILSFLKEHRDNEEEEEEEEKGSVLF